MPVEFQNFEFSYLRDGKPIFVPSRLGYDIGDDVKSQVEMAYKFDDFVYHLKKHGGHIAALHAHRPHLFFARIDIKRFFYSIARNRVHKALSSIGINRGGHYAKWSCVKNPYGGPSYVLPYGFVQSPILATLVLMRSGVGSFLRELVTDGIVTVSVYMDDISLSSNDLSNLQASFDGLLVQLEEANFAVSEEKLCKPAPMIDVFNCDLSHGRSEVRQDRIDHFEAKPHSPASLNAFARYCKTVSDGNA